MNKNEINTVKKIIEDINYYDDLYYNKGISEISDNEYDRLYETFLSYVEKYPEIKEWDNIPTKKVGAGDVKAPGNFEKFTHKSPLLSIDQKSREMDELEKWYKKIGNPEVLVQPKLDGITVNLNYENGKFINVATRGNGYIGDLITKQYKNSDSVYPETIEKANLEIRGEAVIPYSYFKNNEMDGEYSNPRNAVAGILRLKDPNDVKGKGVKTVFYDTGETTLKSMTEVKTDDARLEQIETMGFDTAPYVVCKTWKELKECVENRMNNWIIEKDGFNILNPELTKIDAVCDGLVIKVNDLNLREELGFSQKGPKWAFAKKFKPLQEKTNLIKVDWQVAKSGRITPVAIFREISLGGTKINKATLNNFGYMSKLPTLVKGNIDLEKTEKLHIGDEILVERSNDVIPRIVAIVKHKTNELCKAPQKCPICGGNVEFKNDLLYCINDNCGARISSKIEHFVSRNAMNIIGLGERIIDILLEKGLIGDVADIYELKNHKEDLVTIEGFGKRSVDNILKSIENSKEPELSNFIYALTIPNVGEKMAKDLAKKYKSIHNLINNYNYEDIIGLESFGEVYTKSTIEWLDNKDNIKLIEKILNKGVKPKELKESEKTSNLLAGKTFVITGTLSKPRKHFEELIEANGGKVGSAVSKNTDYLLAGEAAGSKLTKADNLGITILNEEEFEKKLR